MKTSRKFDLTMLNAAFKEAANSVAVKRKVGTVIVDMATETIISSAYNKMFYKLWKASCENEDGETYECVIHSEELAVVNLLKEPHFHDVFEKRRKVLYATYSPCMNCCKMIAHAGIERVVYAEEHRSNFITEEVKNGYSPKQFLISMGIEVTKYDKKEVFDSFKNQDKNEK